MLDLNKQGKSMSFDLQPSSIKEQAKVMGNNPQPHDMTLNGMLQQVGEANCCMPKANTLKGNVTY